MYKIFFGATRFPLAPEEIEISIGNNNETIVLISGEEINILKDPKLTEITLDLLLPNQEIPEAWGYMSGYYLSVLENLKAEKKSFKFKLLRSCDNDKYDDINMLVSLEEYAIKETYEDSGDITVSVTLKKYKKQNVTKIKTKSNRIVKQSVRVSSKKKPKSYKTKKGDTMYLVAKKFYKTTDKALQKALYKYNKKAIDKRSANGKWDMRTLPAGIVMHLPESFSSITEEARYE